MRVVVDLQRDQIVAKLLFSTLFKSLLDQVQTHKMADEKEGTLKKINEALTTMLTSSIHYCPPFVSAILVCAL